MLPSVSAPSRWRRLAAWLLGLYCFGTVVMGLPVEVGHWRLHRVTVPVREFLSDYGVNPWHFVFPGRRGTDKRRNVAVRYTGITPQGERVVLHEAPPGMTGPPVRVFDDARTTVSIKIFSLSGIGQAMLLRDDKAWEGAMRRLRGRSSVRRGVQGFCSSDTLNGGQALASVELDLFTAGIDYETGEQYGRAAHLLKVDCVSGDVKEVGGEAPDRPSWPGVEWGPVR